MTRRDDEMRHVRILEKRKRPVVFKGAVRNNIATIVRDEGAQRTGQSEGFQGDKRQLRSGGRRVFL